MKKEAMKKTLQKMRQSPYVIDAVFALVQMKVRVVLAVEKALDRVLRKRDVASFHRGWDKGRESRDAHIKTLREQIDVLVHQRDAAMKRAAQLWEEHFDDRTDMRVLDLASVGYAQGEVSAEEYADLVFGVQTSRWAREEQLADAA